MIDAVTTFFNSDPVRRVSMPVRLRIPLNASKYASAVRGIHPNLPYFVTMPVKPRTTTISLEFAISEKTINLKTINFFLTTK